jgi:hypothetical protein
MTSGMMRLMMMDANGETEAPVEGGGDSDDDGDDDGDRKGKGPKQRVQIEEVDE